MRRQWQIHARRSALQGADHHALDEGALQEGVDGEDRQRAHMITTKWLRVTPAIVAPCLSDRQNGDLHMSHTLTIRLQDDLAEWVERTARAMGVSQGLLIRDQLEKARREDVQTRPYMRLAGSVRLAQDLSTRKGFSPS